MVINPEMGERIKTYAGEEGETTTTKKGRGRRIENAGLCFALKILSFFFLVPSGRAPKVVNDRQAKQTKTKLKLNSTH